MSFTSRLKTGFDLQLKSFSLLMRRPWLMLYVIVPHVLFKILLLASFKDWLHPNVKSMVYWVPNVSSFLTHLPGGLEIFIVKIVFVFSLAAFIVHVNELLTHNKIQVKKLATNLIAAFIPLILFALCQFGIWWLHYILDITVNRLDYAQHIRISLMYIAHGLLNLLWFWLTFYVLIIITLKKTSIIKAFNMSLQATWHTLISAITGALCIQVVLKILAMLLMLININTLLSSSILVGISLAYTIFALMLYKNYTLRHT